MAASIFFVEPRAMSFFYFRIILGDANVVKLGTLNLVPSDDDLVCGIVKGCSQTTDWIIRLCRSTDIIPTGTSLAITIALVRGNLSVLAVPG